MTTKTKDVVANLLSQSEEADRLLLTNLPRALELYEECRAGLSRELGPENDSTLCVTERLAIAKRLHGHTQEAIELFNLVVSGRQAHLGDEHPEVLKAMRHLALTYALHHDAEKALALGQEVLRKCEKVFGARHRDTLVAMNNMATFRFAVGDIGEAIGIQRAALEGLSELLGPDHELSLRAMDTMIELLLANEQYDEVVALGQGALKRDLDSAGQEHALCAKALHNIGLAHIAVGNRRTGRQILRTALSKSRAQVGEQHQLTHTIRDHLARSRRWPALTWIFFALLALANVPFAKDAWQTIIAEGRWPEWHDFVVPAITLVIVVVMRIIIVALQK